MGKKIIFIVIRAIIIFLGMEITARKLHIHDKQKKVIERSSLLTYLALESLSLL